MNESFKLLGSLPAEIAVLVLFVILALSLIKAITPVSAMIKEQFESRLTLLETHFTQIAKDLSEIRNLFDKHVQEDEQAFQELTQLVKEKK